MFKFKDCMGKEFEENTIQDLIDFLEEEKKVWGSKEALDKTHGFKSSINGNLFNGVYGFTVKISDTLIEIIKKIKNNTPINDEIKKVLSTDWLYSRHDFIDDLIEINNNEGREKAIEFLNSQKNKV